MMFERARQITQSIKGELRVYRLVLADPRTPRLPKILLGLAVGYLLMPFDIVPDALPILGQLDDILIVPGLVIAALKLTPSEVIEDCRRQARIEG